MASPGSHPDAAHLAPHRPVETHGGDHEEIPHDFPKPHMDMLLQSIDYPVPPDKFDELAAYDGSVIAERTKGELAARCDMRRRTS